MRPHRFAVGQPVRLLVKPSLATHIAESYRITRVLPERDNAPQYRIQSDDGKHERVASEDDIEAIKAPG